MTAFLELLCTATTCKKLFTSGTVGELQTRVKYSSVYTHVLYYFQPVSVDPNICKRWWHGDANLLTRVATDNQHQLNMLLHSSHIEDRGENNKSYGRLIISENIYGWHEWGAFAIYLRAPRTNWQWLVCKSSHQMCFSFRSVTTSSSKTEAKKINKESMTQP